MNEQITSAAEPDALTDLVVRLNRANKGLLSQSRTNITSERTRLEGKAEGVRLALSYVEEAIRARPDQPQRADSPATGCTCTGYSEDRGGGYHEYMLEYDPGCPEHSQHVYNPRTQMWEQVEPQRVQPSGNAIGNAIKDAPDEWWLDAAVASVLALFAQQPTVAEVARKAWARGYSDAMGDYEHSDPLPPNPYGESEARRCTSDVTLRNEGHRLVRCVLPEGHVEFHTDRRGTSWTGPEREARP